MNKICRLLCKSTPFAPSVKNKILILYILQITHLRHFGVFLYNVDENPKIN